MKTRPARQAASRASDPSASTAGKNGFSLISEAKLRQLHATMLKCRAIEERASLLGGSRRAGRPALGEAVAVGAAIDLRSGDWIAPSRHDLITGFIKGAALSTIFNSAVADEARQDAAACNIIPQASTVAGQLNLATGVALASKARKNGAIVVAFFDHPADSTGRWNDALSFAALQALPILFVARRRSPANRSQPKRSRRSANAAAQAHASGIPVIPVDAHDVVAIYRVAHESIQKARQGIGPTLIEAIDFTPDLAPDVRNRKVGGPQPHDPLEKMRDYLTTKGLYSAAWEKTVVDKFQSDLDATLSEALASESRRKPQGAVGK